jgi:GMP synthase (glutamine-hydrolysing)
LNTLGDADAVVLHWHGDSFDLPKGAQRLASNAQYENQAFAYGRNALALQFHLETDPPQLEEWYVGHTVELAAAKISVTELRAATSKFANSLASQADRVFTRWLREISQPAHHFSRT